MKRPFWRLAAAALVSMAFAVSLGSTSATGAALPDNYVALGDSYSSGVGTSSYTLDASCKRSTYAYPYLLAQQRANTSLNFVACAGATTDDVINNQISALNSSTTIITISVGGNDLGFGDLVSDCVQSNCNATLTSTRASADATLTPKLNAVYAAIKSRIGPSAKVVVLGYPRLFSSAFCFGTFGVTASERSNGNLLSDEIDRITALRTAAYGFTYESAIAAFTGHAVCSNSAWVNGLNILNSAESFHPTRSGHSAGYLPLVRQVVG